MTGRVDVFLQQSGLTYDELRELLDMRTSLVKRTYANQDCGPSDAQTEDSRREGATERARPAPGLLASRRIDHERPHRRIKFLDLIL